MNYYFLGIGGIGMSALARYFHQQGHQVSGYDRTATPLTRELEQEGISIHYEDNPSLLPPSIDLAVYTPAIPSTSQEFIALSQRGIPLIKRAQALGEITQGKKCIAVAGSHGKTTTSTLIAHLLHHSGFGCTAFLGGISKNFGSNLVVSPTSDYIVVEADEYDHSFLQLHPHYAVITSTDADHLDIYGTHQQLMDAYIQFANQVSPDGHLFLKQGTFLQADGSPYLDLDHHHHHAPEPAHADHHHASSAPHLHLPHEAVSTYTVRGIEADFYAINVRAYGGNLFFDLRTPQGVFFDLELRSTALFNVENAVAAAAVVLTLGLNEHQLRDGLKTFDGVRRRFDYRIREKELVYIDDYAHHPAEIRSTIESVRYLYPGKRLVGIFQPHLYSRTRDLADQFASVLQLLDEVVMLPIYPAREAPLPGVTSSMLLRKIPSLSKYLCTPEQALELVPALCPDVVLTLGAGNIDQLVPQLESTLRDQLL